MYLSSMKRNCLFALALSASLGAALAAAPARAHEPARHHDKWPQASLQAEAAAEVSQDTVRITLATEISDASQAAVAQALNKTLDEVMQKAKWHERIKASSGNYRVWPMNDKDGKITNWRGRGEIVLESADFAAASELASSLSERMPIANLAFFVSPKARAAKEAALLEQAAQAFRDRAQALTTAFGYTAYDIKEINLGGSGAQYEAAPRVMAMAAGAQSKVPLEAGTEMVSVSVQGSIFLRSDKK
jgi:predicted secreted protein